MHALTLLVLAIVTCASATYYRGGYEKNLISRDEPREEKQGELVECPVCTRNVESLESNEVCPITMGNKRFKRCLQGTYKNEVCDNRLDCFRGPGEPCSEKMYYDIYGQKCAPGYYCNKVYGACVGPEFSPNSNSQWFLNHDRRYTLRESQTM